MYRYLGSLDDGQGRPSHGEAVKREQYMYIAGCRENAMLERGGSRERERGD